MTLEDCWCFRKMKINISLDELISKLASIGVPALVLLLTMASTGLAGAAAITASLALLGPGGMVGGVVTLLAGGVLTEVLAQFGIETVISLMIGRMYQDGETQASIEERINGMYISKKLKLKIIDKFKELQPEDLDTK